MDTKEQIIENDITFRIANGLRQVKMAKEDKIRLNTLENLIDELDN